MSDHSRANLGRLFVEGRTTPRLVGMVVTPGGHIIGRGDGEAAFKAAALGVGE
jgi:hypothetical protein